MTKIETATGETDPYTIHYSNYNGQKVGKPEKLEVDMIIGGDGANSRVAKAIDAGNLDAYTSSLLFVLYCCSL